MTTSLDALFDPRSVAVVGASDNPQKWGYWLAAGALAGRARRTVHLVNRRAGALDGVPFLPGLAALPGPADHVVVAVPPQQVRPVVTEGLTAGARCFTVITSGGTSAAEELELAELVRAHGARLLGPNCMGIVDTTSELRLSWGEFPAGEVGVVSQSGNLALEIGRMLARAGQGFSRFVSLGNQRDIDAAEALEALIAHEPTRVIAAYVEDFRDGRRLARVLASASEAGKPVLLLTVGASAASGRAAASHTGALVSARATVEAVCDDAGALLLNTAGELVDTAVLLLSGVPAPGAPDPAAQPVVRRTAAEAVTVPAGTSNADTGGATAKPVASPPEAAHAAPEPLPGQPGTARPAAGPVGGNAPTSGATADAVPHRTPLRVALVGDSGGQGALAADTFAARGLGIPPLSAGTAAAVAVARHLTARAERGTPGNPVDLAGAGEADLGSYARIARTLLESGDADAVVLTGYFGDYATANPAQTDRECAVARELADAARDSRRTLVVHTMARDTPALAVLREGRIPVYERIEQAATALAAVARCRHLVPAPPPELPPAARCSVPDGGYETVRELLASYGLAFPGAEFVRGAEEAAEAARHTGYPLVLKAMGPAHKTEAGAVVLNIADEGALRAAFARMRAATGAERYAVEVMAAPANAVELIVGVRHDPAFGPVAMAGIGGVTAELLADTAVALAPLTPERARALLLSLRHAPLLTGWRGAAPVHLDAAAAALCAVSRAAAEHPELSELEVNPLLVHPDGALALDAHGVRAASKIGCVG
ncbi:acetate--CoA ligase family protein [Streptomyces sp.]|uniref:acetate--CoA ligase family protein n=1 Tax=Streptomyces sp. TaxID=1931 RepID=UPI002D77501D|nr:acetate--CoA ligase family protein [Streptomyces sp.]HET6359395.1 acetate--CoA ligase family protein [Streptomyces sp.]